MTSTISLRVPQAPPGPWAPSPWQLLRLARDPVGYLDECAAAYGHTFRLRIPSLFPTFVLTGDPDEVKRLFTAIPTIVGPGNEPMLAPFSGKTSVAVLDGPLHAETRRMMVPFFKGRKLENMTDALVKVVDDSVKSWAVGRAFKLLDVMQIISQRAIFCVLLGNTQDERFNALPAMIIDYLKADASPLLRLPALQKDLGPWSPWGRFVRLRKRMDELLYAAISSQRERPFLDPDCLLAALIRDIPPEEDVRVRDQILTLFIAGNVTTAVSLSWVFARLLETPEVLRRVESEVASMSAQGGESWVEGCVYLRAAVNETLRLHPTFPYSVPRTLEEEVELAGFTLPAGTQVAAAISVIHRRADLWPQPMEFRPERFLQRFSPYHYLPFGGGNRRCLGDQFALFEISVVVARVLSQVRLRALDTQRPRSVHLGLAQVPSTGVPVVVEKRLSA